MSRMSELLEKRLDDNKYEMWEALKEAQKQMRQSVNWCLCSSLEFISATEQVEEVLKKIGRR